MKMQFLIIFLITGMFIEGAQAMSPRQGSATGGAEAAPDISKCDLKPKEQTKIKIRDKNGKEHFICSGLAVCGGKTVPVSCKVSEREPCPVAKQCIEFGGISRQISTPSRLSWPNEDDTNMEDGISYKLLVYSQDYYPIGQLSSNLENGEISRCTGVLIKNPNQSSKIKFAVLSAASCIYNLRTKKVFDKIHFWAEFPWIYMSEEYNYYASVDKITVAKQFSSGGKKAFDYGLIIFQVNPAKRPSNCCLNMKALDRTQGKITFPAGSYAIQKSDSSEGVSLFKTKIKEFENITDKKIRYIKNNITFDFAGKGSPIIGNNPQGGSEKVVLGINISNVAGSQEMTFSPLWLDNDINNLWKCLERGTIECDVQAP